MFIYGYFMNAKRAYKKIYNNYNNTYLQVKGVCYWNTGGKQSFIKNSTNDINSIKILIDIKEGRFKKLSLFNVYFMGWELWIKEIDIFKGILFLLRLKKLKYLIKYKMDRLYMYYMLYVKCVICKGSLSRQNRLCKTDYVRHN